MKKLLILFLAFNVFSSFAQEDSGLSKEKLYEARKQLRDGNKYYRTNRLEDAAIAYQKSMAEDGTYYKGAYNLGNAFFQQEKYKEAVEQYELANKLAKTKEDKIKTSELIGDSYKKQNDLEKALAAYKQALLKNPKDDILREKFVAAKKEKEKQDQQDKENEDNKDKDQDNKDDQNKDDKKDDKGDNKDDKNKDEDKKNKDNKDDKKDDKKNDEGDKDKDKKEDEEKDGDKPENKDNKGDKGEDEKEQPTQPKESKLSPEQIQQLLESMNNEEQKTQQKVNAQKVKVKKNNNEKDW